jgi:hypothetical protein
MGPAHAGLHIPEAVYNRFLTIALGAVTGAAPSLADQIKTALSPNLLVTDKQAIVETGATPLVPFGGDAGAPTGDAGDAGADGAAPVVCK